MAGAAAKGYLNYIVGAGEKVGARQGGHYQHAPGKNGSISYKIPARKMVLFHVMIFMMSITDPGGS